MKHTVTLGNAARRRAISLIEGVLYLVLALAIIVGGIVFFQQANFNRQVNSVAGMMTSVSSYLIATTKNASRTHADSDFTTGDSTTFAIKSGAIQSDMVDHANNHDAIEVIRSPWGGIVTLREAAASVDGHRTPIVAARLNDLPVGACMRLGHKNSNGTSPIGGSVFALGVEENNITNDNLDWTSGEVLYMANAGEDTDMAALAAACKGGTRDLVIYYDVAGVPETIPSMAGDGTGAGGAGTGDGSCDGSTARDPSCPPEDWVWNPDAKTYTFKGMGLYHRDSRHGATQVSFIDPENTVTIGVPASQDGDIFSFSYSPATSSKTYWTFMMHISRGDLTPPGPTC